jgi:ribosomal protein L29
MATLKIEEIKKMNPKEKEGKLKELKLELIKSQTNASKSGKTKEIKKIIAKILSTNK